MEGRSSSVAADNRLTSDELAALGPGDTVTIESAADFGRPRHAVGTVVRVAGPHIVVSCKSPRGVRYVHHFARRDGVRIGGGHRAELVNTHAVDAVPTEQRRQMLRIDALFREWTRHRADVDKLRRLRDAISECLDKSLVEQA
jgi:hypothetical protein